MRVLAPAKINLHLRVGEPRADGFHPLVTWMCTVGLFDTLDVDRADQGSRAGPPLFKLYCDAPGLPRDSGNLVVRAAERFGAAQGGAGLGVEIRLLKRIPVGAGLGGGSSDGARALAALNELWQTRWDRERLAALSAELGSDFPFFFYGPSAICRGRGELVEPIARPRPRFALLILPGREMPTASVYRRFDEMKGWAATSISNEPDWRRWTHLGAQELLPLLVNDLEAAAFAIDPQLGRLRDDVEQSLSRPVRMSGSGSSLFTLFEAIARKEADEAARRIGERFGVRAIAVDLGVTPKDDLDRSVRADVTEAEQDQRDSGI